MNELTIRKKLYLVFGVLILIFVCNGIYSGGRLYNEVEQLIKK